MRLPFLARGRTGISAGRQHQPILAPHELAALAVQAAQFAQMASWREVHDHHAGDWPSARMGRGLDYEESRPYCPGDDLRDMDWRTTARLAHPFVKIYREERQPQWHLAMDRGSSMRFGTRSRLKVAQAARIAAFAAFAASTRNAAVSASLWDAEDVVLPPRHDRSGVLALTQALSAPCPPLPPAGMNPVLAADRLHRLLDELTRGTQLILISDFAWLDESHRALLGQLTERCTVLAARVVDPAERIMPDVGLARFQDLADGHAGYLNTSSAAMRAQFARTATAEGERVRQWLAHAGVSTLEISSDVDDLLSAWMCHA